MVALRALGLDHRCEFGIEINKSLQDYAARSLNLPSNMPKSGDIRTVDPRQLPETNVFQFSPPCINFAPCGNGEGATGEDADLYVLCARYLAAKFPKKWIYENSSTIVTHQKHEAYLAKLLRTFRGVGKGYYKVYAFKLNARTEGGVPMNRLRCFLVGSSKRDMVSEFVVPGPIPRKKLSTFLETDVIGETLPADTVRVRNLTWGLREIAERNCSLSQNWFIDALASPSRPYVKLNCVPCLTATRASQGGHWCTRTNRMLTCQEMANLMCLGDSFKVIDGFDQRALGHAIGNSICVGVLQRVIQNALRAVDFS